ncbi:MAG: YncE family protein [Gemmatimonadales bacterium]
MTDHRIAFALFSLACGIVPSAHSQTSAPVAGQYHIVKRIAAGGEGGWDYLAADAQNRRLYVSRGTHVMVFDMDRDSLVGDIPNTPGVHGVAIDRQRGHGFTSNGRDSSVTVFDLKTLQPIKTVRITGRNPDAIAFDPASNRVFTFNGASHDASVIDAITLEQVGRIDLGGKPETGQPDGKGMLYVNIEDKGEVVALDTRAMQAKARYSLAPCEEPTGMARDAARGRLIIGCGGNAMMAVMDEKTGKLVTTMPVGRGVDASGFDPVTQLAFTSAGEGNVSVIRENADGTFTAVGSVPTQPRARTMALDEKTHKIYLSTAQFGLAPAPTAENPRPRAPMIPGSFVILVLDR